MQSSSKDLLSIRNSGRSVILLTGAAGFLGSHLAAALHREGHTLLLLARGQGSKGAKDRIRQVMHWHGIPMDDRIEVIDGDIGKPMLGLETSEYSRAAYSVTEIIHCASSTSFAHERKAQTEATNIDGTRRVLEFANASSAQHFTYISTAYVSGDGYPFSPEKLLTRGHNFFNPYESSKLEGELIVADECTKSGIGYTIHRPSVIAGSAATGKSLLFNAMYYVVRFFDTLNQMLLRDLRQNNGKNAALLGVTLLADQRLQLPMRVDLRQWPNAKLNIVPIDYVVSAFMAAYQSVGESGHVYNLVHPNPCSTSDLLHYSERYFNLTGIEPTFTDGTPLQKFNDLEKNFHSFADIYLPYMADPRTFDCSKTSQIALAHGVRCPQLDYEVFSRCIDYARKYRWQSPLKAKITPTVETNARAAIAGALD
jgi:nucleoside-diphosphate-sugar epimerase